jgi:hypothetical protein
MMIPPAIVGALLIGGIVVLFRQQLRTAQRGEEVAKHAESVENEKRDPETEIREWIARAVNGGFESDEDIIRTAAEMMEDEHPDEDFEFLIRRVLAEELKRHRAHARTWPETTDCDRLDRAFAALEQQGIAARQNFTCCQNCGHAEIWEECDALPRARGYTFFHMQDTESAAEGQGLYLAYGATADSDEARIAVGHAVVRALTDAGLSPQWNGEINRRISVPMDWKKRRASV